MNERKEVKQKKENLRPFEWLTSPASLDSMLQPLLQSRPPDTVRAVHVGCGSSLVGEHLAQSLCCRTVWNIDRDEETLQRMKERWYNLHGDNVDLVERMQFVTVDLSEPLTLDSTFPFENGSIDLIVDKSTLDCALCSDQFATGLLVRVHEWLAVGGWYLLISFHAMAFLEPLLNELPGCDWKVVSQRVLERQVEDWIGMSAKQPDRNRPAEDADDATTMDASSKRTVNVLVCQKSSDSTEVSACLVWDEVYRHVHQVNDTWFQSEHPLLTNARRQALEKDFLEPLTLPKAYQVLFTEAEREHLEYDYFLQDWEAFLETHVDCPVDTISLETAVAFLEEMQ